MGSDGGVGGPSFRQSDVFDVSLEGSGTLATGTTGSLSSKTESNTVVENHEAAIHHSRQGSWRGSLNKGRASSSCSKTSLLSKGS